MSIKRKLILDIYDYAGNNVCPLYDNYSDVSGQAVDVFIDTDNTGLKLLTFTLPTTCHADGKLERNFRLDYLKSDYMIKTILDINELFDWYIISEPKVVHNAFSKNVFVTAMHVSQLLKNKNLSLLFSDENKNNVGTCKVLLERILEGTGWKAGKVFDFGEKDGTTKIRTLNASLKTGAYKLINELCDLFDAKPYFNGDSRTVDIYPLNTFSDPLTDHTPDFSDGWLLEEDVHIFDPDTGLIDPSNRTRMKIYDGIILLQYGNNISGVTRTINTSNLITKLYAYGSYGDKATGYCGIDECQHELYTFVLNEDLKENTYYNFSVKSTLTSLIYKLSFSLPRNVKLPKAGDTLIYSLLDPASMMYIWDETNGTAYFVLKGVNGTTNIPAGTPTTNIVKNYFSFMMDYDYFKTIGLFTYDMLQLLAKFQRYAPAYYQKSIDASMAMSKSQLKLIELIGSVKFCKLAIDKDHGKKSMKDGYVYLEVDPSVGLDGVIYRSDYALKKDNYFEWRNTLKLDIKGDPINEAASIVYIISDDGTWEKGYVKEVFFSDLNKKKPYAVTLWLLDRLSTSKKENSRFYLFSYNSVNGHLGSLLAADEAALLSLDSSTTVVTVKHPVYFFDSFTELGEPDIKVNTKTNIDLPQLLYITALDTYYDWAWDYKNHLLYFRYSGFGDTKNKKWKRCYVRQSFPLKADSSVLEYYYNWRESALYAHKKGSSEWLKLTLRTVDKRVSSYFGTVYMYCQRRDRYYYGLFDEYKFTIPDYDAQEEYKWAKYGIDKSSITLKILDDNGNLTGRTKTSTYFHMPPGNYYFTSPYGSYWTFTTTDDLYSGDLIIYNTDDNWFTQIKYYYLDKNGNKTGGELTALKAKSYRFDGVNYHSLNVADGHNFLNGWINTSNGLLVNFFDYEYITNADKKKELVNKGDEFYRNYSFIPVEPSTYYNFFSKVSSEYYIYQFDEYRNFLDITEDDTVLHIKGTSGSFYTDLNCRYIKLATYTPKMSQTYNINAETKFEMLKGMFIISIDGSYPKYTRDLTEQMRRLNAPIPNNYQLLKPTKEKYAPIDMNKLITGHSGLGYINENDVTIFAEYYRHMISVEHVNYRLLPLDIDGVYNDDELLKDALGIVLSVSNFAKYADDTYGKYNVERINAQNDIKKLLNNMTLILGDLYRESIWSSNDYVDGDLDKLYTDTHEKILLLSKPLVSYDINFLDLYNTSPNFSDFGTNDPSRNMEWPDINIMYAAHLIDPGIDVDQWAYISKVHKCYDQPWKTTITLDTNLTKIHRHTFVDIVEAIMENSTLALVKTNKYESTVNKAVTTADLLELNVRVLFAAKQVENVKELTNQIIIQGNANSNQWSATDYALSSWITSSGSGGGTGGGGGSGGLTNQMHIHLTDVDLKFKDVDLSLLRQDSRLILTNDKIKAVVSGLTGSSSLLMTLNLIYAQVKSKTTDKIASMSLTIDKQGKSVAKILADLTNITGALSVGQYITAKKDIYSQNLIQGKTIASLGDINGITLNVNKINVNETSFKPTALTCSDGTVKIVLGS